MEVKFLFLFDLQPFQGQKFHYFHQKINKVEYFCIAVRISPLVVIFATEFGYRMNSLIVCALYRIPCQLENNYAHRNKWRGILERTYFKSAKNLHSIFLSMPFISINKHFHFLIQNRFLTLEKFKQLNG